MEETIQKNLEKFAKIHNTRTQIQRNTRCSFNFALTHHRKLYRSSDNKIIGGVCGGLAEYMNIDPTVVRLSTALLFLFTGIMPGVLVYIIALFIIPLRSHK